MKRYITSFVAVLLLVLMVVLSVASLKGDSLTFDESAHIPAGYSYVSQQDMRLNPEHPPLAKDLAALPLLFQEVNIPTDIPAWQEDINGQWAFGHTFLFESGNNAEKIIFSARGIMLLFLVLTGLYVFLWARKRYGDSAALIALALFNFSPTFLAHGRYVTTDVAAAFGFLFALYYFVQVLQKPQKKYILYAGLSFGVAQLIKFSLILLIPLYIGLLFLFWATARKPTIKEAWRYIKIFIAVVVIGFLLVWPVYQFHTLNYPQEVQLKQTEAILNTGEAPLEDVTRWMIDKPLLRPYAQYALGLSMVFLRTSGGNTTYFLGEVSSEAWPSYFPIMFGVKVPLAALLLMLIALGVGGKVLLQRSLRWEKISKWIQSHKHETTWIVMVAFYWLVSIMGNLNIGVRHVLPTFPFIYLLTVWGLQEWTADGFRKKLVRGGVITLLIVWYVVESLFAFPGYLSYFNQIAGGAENGHTIAVDSNLDWGQDLKRLGAFVEKNNIETIKLAYFGGDDPERILGDAYKPLNASEPGQTGWLAISATFLQGGRAEPAKGFEGSTRHHEWLNAYTPVTKIGNSIFIYYVEADER